MYAWFSVPISNKKIKDFSSFFSFMIWKVHLIEQNIRLSLIHFYSRYTYKFPVLSDAPLSANTIGKTDGQVCRMWLILLES